LKHVQNGDLRKLSVQRSFTRSIASGDCGRIERREPRPVNLFG
jgi:hypothetical protein